MNTIKPGCKDAPVSRTKPPCPECGEPMSRFPRQDDEPDTGIKAHAAGWECACGHAVYDDFGPKPEAVDDKEVL